MKPLLSCLLFCVVAGLSGCSNYQLGKFNPNLGVPSFIKVGETTKNQVFATLGEPSVHRHVAGDETAIYTYDEGRHNFFGGSYSSSELVIRFQNNRVSFARIEKTGSGRGTFISPDVNNNNPATRAR